MTAVTVQDLDNAKLDCDTIAEIATSLSDTTTDRLGNSKLTMTGAVNTMKAMNPRGAWATSTAYNPRDLVTNGGTTYIVTVAHTSGVFATDLAAGKLAVYQGVIGNDLANSSDATKGAALVGFDGGTLADYFKLKNFRLVATLGDLRALSKDKFQHAYVIERGGSFYDYVASDSSSTDNDGDRIVGADNGRWYLKHDGVVSVSKFGALGDGSVTIAAMQTALANAWTAALARTFDLYFPPGTYDTGEQNFPFRNTGSGLLDCKGIRILCAGPSTILRTTSVGGADVLQLNALQNFSVVGFPTLSSSVSGTASGSNGCSVTNGWDNLYLELNAKNCRGLDKGTFIDGGRAFSIQTGTGPNLRGRLKAIVWADSCTEGFGYEPDLNTAYNHPTDVEVELQAKRCYIGVKGVAAPSSGALSASMTMGVRVRAHVTNCQHDVLLQRMHGMAVDCEVNDNQTAAVKRTNPNTGAAWFVTDTVVDSLQLVYLKNGFIRMRGNKGACDYKVQIGGAAAGSSTLNGATEYCDIMVDVGGAAAIAEVNSINSGGNSIRKSKLDLSPVTLSALAWPADWSDKANDNFLTFGASYEGSFTATLTGCTTAPTATVRYSVARDLVTLTIPSLTAVSNSALCTLTGMPSNLWPTNLQGNIGFVNDNSAAYTGRIEVGTNGVIQLYVGTSTGFTASGTKGIQLMNITYRRGA